MKNVTVKILWFNVAFSAAIILYFYYENSWMNQHEGEYQQLKYSIVKFDSLNYDSLYRSWEYLIRTINCNEVSNDSVMFFLTKQTKIGREYVDLRDQLLDEVRIVDQGNQRNSWMMFWFPFLCILTNLIFYVLYLKSRKE